MANSSLISDIKEKLIEEMINDDAVFYAINSPEVTDFSSACDLINTHIFRYNQNPISLKKTISFITIQVHLPRAYDNNLFVKAQLEIWIYSHESCMKVSNIPGITADRNDYLSQLLDEKFNGRDYLGLPEDNQKLKFYGTLDLISNVEGAFAPNYLYRRMIFETKDVNDSLCNGGKYAS